MVVKKLGANEADEIMFSSGSLTNSEIEPLSTALITRALDELELKYSIDQDGDILVVFSNDALGGDLLCWLMPVGEEQDIFNLLCTVPPTIPKEYWPQALTACNDYHGNVRYGRTYLAITDGKPEAKLYFDNHIDLRDGVTQTHLQRLIMLNLYGAHVFFETVSKKGLYSGRTPVRRKTTKGKGVPQKSE